MKSPPFTRVAGGVAAAPAACRPRNELAGDPIASVDALKQLITSGSVPVKFTVPYEASCHVQPDGAGLVVASAACHLLHLQQLTSCIYSRLFFASATECPSTAMTVEFCMARIPA
jgi:hypothetical protein